jgi:hypothetical protein
MKLAFLDNKDFWGGLMLIAVGAAAMIMARNYHFGSALRMGPGYFPTLLGGVLTLFGLYLTVSGMRSSEKIERGWSPRALIGVPLSLMLFGLLMEHAGFVPAMVALIFGSAASGSEFRFVEILLFTILLTALSVALFIWALGLPYPLFAGF